MEISVTEMNRATLFTISGRIDSSNANQLGDALNARIDAGTLNIVVDLEKVDYLSSGGLRELVGALKRVKNDDGDLRLCSLPPRIQDVLELAGLDALFQVFETQVLAVGSF
ncbi:MAG: STAS domain-containing protein [Anaerolineae bacterium]|nr:STAS domain-containing protein [Anaerolineae bacterium]